MTPENAFWQWFVKHEEQIFAHEREGRAVIDALNAELARIDADVTYEFGPVRHGKREMVLSANGKKSAFPAIEALCASVPELDRFTIVKFRPRRPAVGDVSYAGVSMRSSDVRFHLCKDTDPEKVGVLLFLPGYSPSQRTAYGGVGYLMLDEALGEYAIETQVGFIEFANPSSPLFEGSHPISGLPAQFDAVMAKKNPKV
jgi:hypothetical protein